MPLLLSLGQHSELEAVRARLINGERLFAFLDDVYVTTTPNRVGTVHNILQEELYQHSRIHINIGKTQVWNAAGFRPPACDQLSGPGCGGGPGCHRQNKNSASRDAGGPPRLRPSVFEDSFGRTRRVVVAHSHG